MSTRFDFNIFLVFSKNRPAIVSIIKIIRSNNNEKIAFNAYVLTA